MTFTIKRLSHPQDRRTHPTPGSFPPLQGASKGKGGGAGCAIARRNALLSYQAARCHRSLGKLSKELQKIVNMEARTVLIRPAPTRGFSKLDPWYGVGSVQRFYPFSMIPNWES